MKRLYRSESQKIIGGVCGGAGDYFDIDPIMIRLIWVILFFFGGIGLVAYLIAWIIIPIENSVTDSQGQSESENQKKESAGQNTKIILGILLILFGVFFFMKEFWYLDCILKDTIKLIWRYFFPALLIALGVYIIVQGEKKSK